MQGNGFEQQVQLGDTVTGGQQIMTFSMAEIKKAGYPTTAVVVILNSNEYSSIEIIGDGEVTKADELIQVS
jgi:phosphotransferase system IIA component